MALFVDFLLKRKAERDKKHDSVYNKQGNQCLSKWLSTPAHGFSGVRWGGHCCEEVPEESLRHVHQPSSEDLIGPGLAQDQFSLERQEKLRQLVPFPPSLDPPIFVVMPGLDGASDRGVEGVRD